MDLNRITTKELVAELCKRRGVHNYVVKSRDSETLEIDGPATVLVTAGQDFGTTTGCGDD